MSLTFIIGLIAILGGTAAILDNLLRQEQIEHLRIKLDQWWITLAETNYLQILSSTQYVFLELFDKIYGKIHFSKKCFLISTISSLFALCISIVICILVGGNNFYISISDLISLTILHKWFIPLLLGNFIADYFSLIETRILIRFAINKSIPFLLCLLVVDILLSYCIYELIAVPIYILFVVRDIPNIFHIYWLKDIESVYNIFAVTPFILSTFFTSIIFYIFLIWVYAARISIQFIQPFSQILKWLAELQNPFTVIASFSGGIVLIWSGYDMIIKLFN